MELSDLAPQMGRLLKQLDAQRKECARVRGYHDCGETPIPKAIVKAKLRTLFGELMPMANAPWATVAVDSTQDRLEVTGIRTGDKTADADLMQLWEVNQMAAESSLAHNAALVDGRAFATVWPDDDGEPEVVLDDATQVAVEYIEGRHKARHRVAAIRSWKDDEEDRRYLTLYRRDGLYKFVEAKTQQEGGERVKAGDVWWEKRADDGDVWPLPNPFGRVPVVELGVNRRLRPGRYLDVRGEFASCTGLLDRINLLTFLGLVVAVWMGFPVRGVTGIQPKRRILRDDDDQPIVGDDGAPKTEAVPVELDPSAVLALQDAASRLVQLDAADRSRLSALPELEQFSAITKTPRYYFPTEQGYSNISADMVRATEGPLHAKVRGLHKPTLGEGWEEVVSLMGLMAKDAIDVPPTVQVLWADHESRSLAERADAATKIASLQLPPLMVAEKYLGWDAAEIKRAEREMLRQTVLPGFRDLLAGGVNGQAPDGPAGGEGE